MFHKGSLSTEWSHEQRAPSGLPSHLLMYAEQGNPTSASAEPGDSPPDQADSPDSDQADRTLRSPEPDQEDGQEDENENEQELEPAGDREVPHQPAASDKSIIDLAGTDDAGMAIGSPLNSVQLVAVAALDAAVDGAGDGAADGDVHDGDGDRADIQASHAMDTSILSTAALGSLAVQPSSSTPSSQHQDISMSSSVLATGIQQSALDVLQPHVSDTSPATSCIQPAAPRSLQSTVPSVLVLRDDQSHDQAPPNSVAVDMVTESLPYVGAPDDGTLLEQPQQQTVAASPAVSTAVSALNLKPLPVSQTRADVQPITASVLQHHAVLPSAPSNWTLSVEDVHREERQLKQSRDRADAAVILSSPEAEVEDDVLRVSIDDDDDDDDDDDLLIQEQRRPPTPLARSVSPHRVGAGRGGASSVNDDDDDDEDDDDVDAEPDDPSEELHARDVRDMLKAQERAQMEREQHEALQRAAAAFDAQTPAQPASRPAATSTPSPAAAASSLRSSGAVDIHSSRASAAVTASKPTSKYSGVIGCRGSCSDIRCATPLQRLLHRPYRTTA